MKFELNEYHRNVSDQDLIADLERVARELKKEAISRNEYNERGKYSEGTLRKRFGGWLNALDKAGLKKTKYYLMDNEILDELNRVANLLGKKFLTTEDLRKHSEITNATVVTRHFGSWNVALKKAGLNVSPMGRRYSTEEYFENLLNVWTYLGRQPLFKEMNVEPSRIPSSAYEHRFGGWRKVLEAFVARMNEKEPTLKYGTQSSITKQEHVISKSKKKKVKACILPENRREIGLSLRYKVLNRDKFKCIKCGASPATEHSCRLHVDHKIPFSRGGKTTPDNLQTLCQNCNLGKGVEANL